MGSFTNYLEKELLDYAFGNQSYTPPSTMYVGLSSTAINEDGTGITEPSGGGYARVAVDNNLTTWSAAVVDANDVSTKDNDINIEFPEATTDWGTMTHFFIADAETGGNILGYGELNAAVTITAQDMARFVSYTLVINLS